MAVPDCEFNTLVLRYCGRNLTSDVRLPSYRQETPSDSFLSNRNYGVSSIPSLSAVDVFPFVSVLRIPVVERPVLPNPGRCGGYRRQIQLLTGQGHGAGILRAREDYLPTPVFQE